ncbi:SpoIIE family protein phosphatase [Alkalihalobacterium bogoriense]|uniref:SpoIIE family protein phosphatase n=1 Tax=Alkalihalobacterium bogoriense TaxID=246272 RepID=UPI0006844C8E|nr:SpoIIE family protein phosphatase [Alkalihalobacterium bogoriense]
MIRKIKKLVESFSSATLFSSKTEEINRLLELYEMNIVESTPDKELDQLTELVAKIFHTPIAMVTLMTEEKLLYKSCFGLNMQESPRNQTVCQYIIASKDHLVIEDLQKDERFADNLTVNKNGFRFYVGVPLKSDNGNVIGTLCLLDYIPREFSNGELDILQTFSEMAARIIEKRSDLLIHAELESKLMDINSKYLSVINHVRDVVFQTNLVGEWTFLNPSWEEIMGYKVEESIGTSSLQYVYHEDKENCIELFTPFFKGDIAKLDYICRFVRKNGTRKWIRVSSSKTYTPDGEVVGVSGTLSDITNIVELETEKQKDLELAKKVQLSVISDPILNENIKVNCEYYSSSDLSGDMYYSVQIDKSKYGVILIDVMGHGIASSLISMSIRSLLRGLIIKVQDPIIVYEELNKHIQFLLPKTSTIISYFTAIYLIIDTELKTVEYINAGHPVGLMVTDNKVFELNKGSLPIGLMESPPLQKGILSYENKANIILYTDGLSEIDNIHNPKEFLLGCNQQYNATENKENLAAYIIHSCNLPEKLPDDLCIISIELT